MSAVIISTNPAYTHGLTTVQIISRLVDVNTRLERTSAAVATASSGFSGTPGTQFEIGNPPAEGETPPVVIANLFGVQASATPGEQGSAYAFALNRLHELWGPFWTEARPFIEQLDNGA